MPCSALILLKKKDSFTLFYVYVYIPAVCMCPMCVPGAHGGQKSVLDSLELELQMVVSHVMWVLRSERRPSGRT